MRGRESVGDRQRRQRNKTKSERGTRQETMKQRMRKGREAEVWRGTYERAAIK